MRRRVVRAMGVILVGLLAAGVGLASAQDKPGPQKDKQEAAAAADPITGSWDGTVETPNGTVAFGLVVKVEKDKVSGEISNQEGGTPVTGTWADGKLSLTFDYNGNPIVMGGALKDEVLSGQMDWGGGQALMPWTAKKRAAS